MLFRLWTLSVLLLNTVSLAAVEDTVAEVQQRRVATIVEKLGSDNFDARQEASAELNKLDVWALPLLKKHREATKDAEVLSRLDRAIQSLTPPPALVGEKRVFGITVGRNSSATSVLLDGSPSWPLAASNEDFQWKQVGGADLNLTPRSLRRACPILSIDKAGTYTFELSVNRGGRWTLPATVEVVIVDSREALEQLRRREADASASDKK
jgi:hypothetical protein